jgi:hypothetical protein
MTDDMVTGSAALDNAAFHNTKSPNPITAVLVLHMAEPPFVYALRIV